MIGKNNPLNIRASKSYTWLGQEGETRGFCDFKSVTYCYRVGAYLIMRSYRRRGVYTLSEIIKNWAPPSENPTTTYVKFVRTQVGVTASFIPRSIEHVAEILCAMEIFEQGYSQEFRETWYEKRVKLVESWIKMFELKFA